MERLRTGSQKRDEEEGWVPQQEKGKKKANRRGDRIRKR